MHKIILCAVRFERVFSRSGQLRQTNVGMRLMAIRKRGHEIRA